MQLDLFNPEGSLTPDAFVAFLNAGARRTVKVTFTRNRVTMASVRFPPDGPVKLRLHGLFLSAPLDVRMALKQYLRTHRKETWAVVADFAMNVPASDGIGNNAIRKKPVTQLTTRGRVYNLKHIFDDVNACFFTGRVRCRIGWGRDRATARRRRRSKSIRYGSWNPQSETIRIHPRLDDVRVPREFIRYIVFHEMLHTVVPSDVRNGRRFDHPPAFKKLEKQYPEHRRMYALSKELLDVLV